MNGHTVDVKGDYNKITIGSSLEETSFSAVNLDDAKPPSLESPPITAKFLQILRSAQLLVLGGTESADKSTFARHLAWCLQAETRDRQLSVQQWHQGSKPSNPEEALRNLGKPTILVVTGVLPKHFSHDLLGLYGAVRRYKHWTILTSESKRSQWLSQGHIFDRIWEDIDIEDIYTKDYLISYFIRKLEEARSSIPSKLPPPDMITADYKLLANMTIRDAAIQLRTPRLIQRFIDLLSGNKSVTVQAIQRFLSALRNDRPTIESWYKELEPRKQIFTLGLSLFDGLFSDQVFAGLETLVEEIWRKRDPGFPQFDHYELQGVEAYFQGTENPSPSSQITSFSNFHRKTLLQTAWALHRRLMTATIPMLSAMISDSIQRGHNNPETLISELPQSSAASSSPPPPPRDRLSAWQANDSVRELFGSPLRSRLLRETFSEALSYLALLDLGPVEPSLLDLAASPQIAVKNVTAAALARWHDPKLSEDSSTDDCSSRLLEALHRWQDEAFLLGALKWNKQRAAERFSEIRATVAITASLATQYDPPDHMDKKLFSLFRKIAADQDPIVAKVFREHTLPLIVATHFGQLESFLLEDIAYQNSLLDSLAIGLADACVTRPRDAVVMLDRWYVAARARRGGASATPAENILAVVILVYSLVDLSILQPHIQPDTVFNRLREVLAEENNILVRRAVFLASAQHTLRYFEQVAPLVRDLAAYVDIQERGQVLAPLTQLYLNQRESLAGGDVTVELNGRRFPAWTGGGRPPTQVETVLLAWLRDEASPEAQQLALAGLAALHATALEQQEPYLAAQAKGAAPRGAFVRFVSEPRISNSLRPTPELGKLAIAATAPPEARTALKAPFGEILFHSSAMGADHIRAFISKWKRFSDPQLQTFFAQLEKALNLFNYRGLLITLLVLALLFLLVKSC